MNLKGLKGGSEGPLTKLRGRRVKTWNDLLKNLSKKLRPVEPYWPVMRQIELL